MVEAAAGEPGEPGERGGVAQTETPATPATPETLPATLAATVLASRLRRGQWEAEVELDPERLAALAEPDGSTGSAEPSGVGADATAEPEPVRATRATALTRRPHASGARVTLSLDPARTARL